MNLHSLTPPHPSNERLLPYLNARWPQPTGNRYIVTPDNKIWVQRDNFSTLDRIYIFREDLHAAAQFDAGYITWGDYGEEEETGYWDNSTNAIDYDDEDSRSK